MINQNVLALDLATKTGWAIRGRDGAVTHGILDARARRGQLPAQRWVNFNDWLNQTITNNNIHVIGFEEVRRHVGTTAAHVHGGLRAIMEMVALTHNIEVLPYGVGTVKKHWTGNGRATKDSMMQQARARGYDPKDDNAADALAVLALMFINEDVEI